MIDMVLRILGMGEPNSGDFHRDVVLPASQLSQVEFNVQRSSPDVE